MVWNGLIVPTKNAARICPSEFGWDQEDKYGVIFWLL